MLEDVKSKSQRVEMPFWPLKPLRPLGGDGRERTLKLLGRLGNPHLKLPPVIHVAGTNGKGSTIAFLRAMLEAAGYKVHTYTSPHLIRFNERIVLAGEEVEDRALQMLLEETRQAAGDMPVEVFEGHTAAAFLAFSRTAADIVLIETGMGGRFDPTNVVPKPALTIITSVSYDHTEALGQSLKEIAWHKSGIMREGVPCVVGPQAEEAIQSIAREAKKTGTPLHIGGLHWEVEPEGRFQNAGFTFFDGNGEVSLPKPGLRGIHQFANAGNAIAALTLLDGFEVGQEAILKGLQQARWMGRLERIPFIPAIEPPHPALSPEGRGNFKQGERGSNWELWFDGAHNAGGASAIATFAHKAAQDKPLYLICGTTRGKDAAGLLMPFLDLAKLVYAVPVRAEPDSYSAEEMATFAHLAGIEEVRTAESLREAIVEITEDQPPGRILVFGSLFLRIELA